MTYRATPDEAVEAGAPASPYLMRNLRDNDEAIANGNLTIAEMLDGSTGHVHGVGTRGYTYTFTDRVTIVTGVNDRVPFRFGGTSQAATNESATLDPGTYTLTALAAEIQAEMRSEATASTEISVVYDLTEGSPTRGLFVFRHTGASDSPNTRVLELHFATGTGFAAGVGPSIGFAKLDKKRAFAYAGDSGFSDGHTQDAHTAYEGGLLSTDAWVAGAFTSAKMAANVISTRVIQNNAVSGSAGNDHIQDGALDAVKLGSPVHVAPSGTISAGSTGTISITMPNTRTPMVQPYTPDGTVGTVGFQFEVVSVTNTGGSNYDVVVKNNDSANRAVGLVAY